MQAPSYPGRSAKVRGVLDVSLEPEFPAASSAVPPPVPPRLMAGAVESDVRFGHLMDHAPVMIWASAADGRYQYFNLPWLTFTGRNLDQEAGFGWRDNVHDEDRTGVAEVYDRQFASRKPFRAEYRLRRHDGVFRWLLDQATPRSDPDGSFIGFIGTCIDITEMKEAEARRQRDLDEKTALLEELHHRVRNNAQLFASLLTMQASRSSQGEVKQALATAAARASTLAVAQDQMHATEDPGSFDLHNYLYNLTQAAGPMTPPNVRISVEAAESVWVPLSTVVPIGLIVHELLTNAMRHAFPNGRRGVLQVRIRRTPLQGVMVEVADDGVGLPEGFDFADYPTTGSTIVRRLASQLQASLTAGLPDPPPDAGPGARITLELPHAILAPVRAPRPATVSAFAR